MTTLLDHTANSDLGLKFFLFQVDLSIFGEENLYFYPGDENSAPVTYDEIEYTPWPIEFDGFSITSDGGLPRPRITLANVDGIFNPLIINNDDLKGATVTRIITFGKFLDDGADPDPDMHYPPDVYYINKKTSHRMEHSVSFELVAAVDLETVTIPRRLVIRETCDLEYRLWDSVNEVFVYTNATCPHVGASFDVDGISSTDANDVPSKKFDTCCVPRFTPGPYPFGAFPGVARYRRR